MIKYVFSMLFCILSSFSMIASAALPGKPKVRKRAIPITKPVPTTTGASGSGRAAAAVAKADEEDLTKDTRDAKKAKRENEAADEDIDPDATQEIVRAPHVPDFALASVLPVAVLRELVYSYFPKEWSVSPLGLNGDKLTFLGSRVLAIAEGGEVEPTLSLHTVNEHGAVEVRPKKQAPLLSPQVHALHGIRDGNKPYQLVLAADMLHVFDTNKELVIRKFRRLTAPSGQVQTNSDASSIAYIDCDGLVRLYNEKENKEHVVSKRTCKSLAQVDAQLAVGSEGLVRIFDLSSGGDGKSFNNRVLHLNRAGFYKRHNTATNPHPERDYPKALATIKHQGATKLIVGRGLGMNFGSVGLLNIETGKFEAMHYCEPDKSVVKFQPMGDSVAMLYDDSSVSLWNPSLNTMRIVSPGMPHKGAIAGDIAVSKTRYGVPMLAWAVKDDYSDEYNHTCVATLNKPTEAEELWLRSQDTAYLAQKRAASLLLRQQRASASAAGSAAVGVSPQLAQQPGSLGAFRLSDLA